MDSKRYVLLDSLRGLMILLMIAYHTLWDMVYIFNVNALWFKSTLGFIWQQGCWIFFLLSGFCWSLGRRKLKRGLQVFGASIIISAVTIIFMPENVILFGVLSSIGTSMIVMIPLNRIFRKVNPYIGMIVCFGLFIVTRNINSGSLGFCDLNILELPKIWYKDLFTAYLGFPPQSFSSSDYFSVFPWVFLYQTGYFLHGVFRKKEWFDYLTRPRIKFLEWIGRNSLVIYMIHQPIIYVILMILF